MSLAGTIDKPVFAGFRGPCPPFRVCPECGTQSEFPWVNPILEGLTKIGAYAGEVTGGSCLCAHCEVVVEQRSRKEPPTMLNAPVGYAKARLSELDPRPAFEAAIEAAARFLEPDATHDLYVCGPVGVGKTLLACALGNELAQRGAQAWFVRTPVLLLKLVESMTQDQTGTLLSEYVEPTILVLDDVGAEKGSDYARRTLQTLYDMRRDVGRRTIWTSNLDLGQLSEFLADDRLSSRIAGAADVVWIGGDDIRARGRERDGVRTRE